MELLIGLNEAGTTIIMVTHDGALADHAHRPSGSSTDYLTDNRQHD